MFLARDLEYLVGWRILKEAGLFEHDVDAVAASFISIPSELANGEGSRVGKKGERRFNRSCNQCNINHLQGMPYYAQLSDPPPIPLRYNLPQKALDAQSKRR